MRRSLRGEADARMRRGILCLSSEQFRDAVEVAIREALEEEAVAKREIRLRR